MPSLVVPVVGQKGGTGKSRIAQAFAVACGRAKVDVLLADMDRGPTGSLAWGEVRRLNKWTPVIRVERLDRGAFDALDGRGDVVIVDTAGFADKLTRDLAAHAHLVLVPVGTDLGDWQPTVDLLHQLANVGIDEDRLAPMIVRGTSSAKVEEARAYMTAAGYPPLKSATLIQAAYQDAFNVGKSMIECAHEGPRTQAERQIVEIGTRLEAIRRRLYGTSDKRTERRTGARQA